MGILERLPVFDDGPLRPPPFLREGPAQLQCELEITSQTSWSAYMQDVGDPDYGFRCSEEREGRECNCQNPLIPEPHNDSLGERWTYAFDTNLESIAQLEQAMESSKYFINNDLDVVFLGDSITEHWRGTGLGQPRERYVGNAQVFQSLFGYENHDDDTYTTNTSTSNDDKTTDSSNKLTGIPLGIGGDRTPHLLYRLQNGELAPSLHPKIWWILIGTNDRGGDRCQKDQVIAGTIAIAEYIRQERPDATIVLNSILPRGPGTPRGLDQWRYYYEPINQALECYVRGQELESESGNRRHNGGDIYFFNATDVFLTSDLAQINLTLLPDELHPEEEGSWVWGRAIRDEIQDILSSSPDI